METNKKMDIRLIGFTTAAAVLGMGFAAALGASAATTADSGWQRGVRGGCDPEQHAAVEKAIEDNDYAAWKELMGDRGRITEVITEENFDTFAKLHAAIEAGDTEEAQSIREQLGLGIRPQDGTGYRHGMGRGGMHRGTGSGDGTNNRWTNS